MMFKKIMCVLTACILGLCALCACGGGHEELGGENNANENTPGNIPDEELLEGNFYSLGEAYEAGWLTQEDLKSIAYYHNGGRAYNEEIMSEDYTPIPKAPATLDAVTDKSIRQTFWNDNFRESSLNYITLDEIEIGNSYYGCYNGCIAINVWYGNTVSDAIWKMTIDGVNFFRSVYVKIQIWRAETV